MNISVEGLESKGEVEEFCRRAGLAVDEGVAGEIAWFVVARDDDGIAGSCALELYQGRAFLELVGVRAELRGIGLGRRIVSTALELLARQRHGSVWVVARTPGFFLSLGFEEERETELVESLLKGCRRCAQYRDPCVPRIMRFDLSES